jgi:hypothetical protein
MVTDKPRTYRRARPRRLRPGRGISAETAASAA